MTPFDSFKGDDTALVDSIVALIEIDEDRGFSGPGIGGHARTLLASAAARLLAAARASPKPALTQGGVVKLIERLNTLTDYAEGPYPRGFTDLCVKVMQEAATALERLAGERGGEAWRPIESAPKDGTRMLLGGCVSGPRVDVGSWGNGRYLGKTRGYERAWADGPRQIHSPTHWMPLPALPGAAPQRLAVEVEREQIEGIVRTALLNAHGIDDLKFSERVKELTRLSGEAADAILTAHPALGEDQGSCQTSPVGRGDPPTLAITGFMDLLEKVETAISLADISVIYDFAGRQYTHVRNASEVARAILCMVADGVSRDPRPPVIDGEDSRDAPLNPKAPDHG